VTCPSIRTNGGATGVSALGVIDKLGANTFYQYRFVFTFL
jgi:hypothetical protein